MDWFVKVTFLTFPCVQIDVLKEIHYIDSDLVVQLKGRVACEMNSGEELISTECLFENQLDDLEPEEAVAIMSALVFQQRNTSEPSLTPKLADARKRLDLILFFKKKTCACCHFLYDAFEEFVLSVSNA